MKPYFIRENYSLCLLSSLWILLLKIFCWVCVTLEQYTWLIVCIVTASPIVKCPKKCTSMILLSNSCFLGWSIYRIVGWSVGLHVWRYRVERWDSSPEALKSVSLKLGALARLWLEKSLILRKATSSRNICEVTVLAFSIDLTLW